MCGLLGYFGRKSAAPSAVTLNAALGKLAHRGPDCSASVARDARDEKVVLLGHTRLSIIDLHERSSQPFELNGNVLAFNGEIYNYKELRTRLSWRGYDFLTDSDTEVLAAALDCWGIDATEYLEGMWAFAWYVASDDVLYLCRDRFGEKPLYYYKDRDGIYFASETKALRRFVPETLAVNQDKLLNFLVNGYKSTHLSSESFYKGVFEVPAREFIRVNPSLTLERKIFWEATPRVDCSLDRQDAVERTRELLTQAVKIRLRADVPAGFCMSGGIDSNSIIAIAKTIFDYPVHGFTIVNTDGRYEENDQIQLMKNRLGLAHTEIPVSHEDFLDNLKRQVAFHDAPVYTISFYLHNLLMSAMHESGMKVSFSGTAADEIFTGYYSHHVMYLEEMRCNSTDHQTALANWEEHIKPIVRNPYYQNPDLYLMNRDFVGDVFHGSDTFATYLIEKNWSSPLRQERYSEGLLRNRMLNQLFHEHVPIMLHEDDLNAMQYSVENRSPFLDRQLVEFAFSIPDQLLIKDGMAKSVLRESMKGIVPSEILFNRRKVGLNAPILELLDVKNDRVCDFLLGQSEIFDLVDRTKILEIIGLERTLKNSESKFLFNFVSTKLFLDECSN